MSCVLRYESARLLPRAVGDRLDTGKRRWIKIVPEIEAHRTDWRLVAQPYSKRMRYVVIVALACGELVQAEIRVLLVPAQQAVQHVPAVGKDIPSILKKHEAQVVFNVGQIGWRKTHFQIVHEKRAAADGKAGYRVSILALEGPFRAETDQKRPHHRARLLGPTSFS